VAADQPATLVAGGEDHAATATTWRKNAEGGSSAKWRTRRAENPAAVSIAKGD